MANGTNWTKAKKNAYQKAWYQADKKKTNINKKTAEKIFQASQNLSQNQNQNQSQSQQTNGEAKTFTGASDANKFFGVGSGAWQDWKDGLTTKEMKSIERYTGSAYHSINDALRNGTTPSVDTQKSIDGLRSAIAKAELTEEIVVYRGCSGKIFGGSKTLAELQQMAKSGKILNDKGFGSSAVTLDDAWSHKGYVMEIHIFPGKGQGQWVDPISTCHGENEYLCKDNASYIMTDAQMKKGKKVVTVYMLQN